MGYGEVCWKVENKDGGGTGIDEYLSIQHDTSIAFACVCSVKYHLALSIFKTPAVKGYGGTQ